MTMKKRGIAKRFLTIALSLALIITMLPAMNYQWVEEADAVTYKWVYNASDIKGSTYTKSTKLASLLDEIFNGNRAVVFTDSACTNAVNTALSSARVLPNDGIYKYVPEGLRGTSCWIYANGVYHALFGGKTGNKNDFLYSDSEILANNAGNASYSNFVKWGVRQEPGAMIRASGHSMILLYYDSEKIVTLDANGNRNGGIGVRIRTWNNATFKVEYIIQVKESKYRQLYPISESSSTENLNTSYAGTYICTKAGAPKRVAPYNTGKCAATYGSGEYIQIVGGLYNSVPHLWYKTSDGYYIFSGNVKKAASKPAVASTLNIAMNAVSVTLGKPRELTGQIGSNYKITSVIAYMDGTEISKFSPNILNVNIQKSAINKFPCATLSAGTHTLKIVATDSSGKTVTKNVTVTVTGTSYTVVNIPSIKYDDIYEGKRVTITNNTSGSELFYYHYLCNGKNKSTKNNSVTFDINETSEVTAYSTLNGRMSGQAYAAITVNKLATPAITVKQKGDIAYVTIANGDVNAEIYYSINGGSYNQYRGTFDVTSDCTISAYAKRKGYKSSDTVSEKVSMTVPETPNVPIVGDESAIAAGGTIAVKWNQDDKATSYIARLYKEVVTIERLGALGFQVTSNYELIETASDITQTTKAFTLEDAGKYRITVEAVNSLGKSDESSATTVEAKAPVKITFQDSDETVLNELSVDYNTNVSEVPKPSKRGYVFVGWKANSEGASTSLDAYKSVKFKTDTTYVAQYQKEVYKVKFLDTSGKVMSIKEVEYDDAAVLPEYTDVPEGYKFVGWNITNTSENDSKCDYSHVDCNMELQAVVIWENSELPVKVSDIEAIANGDAGYSVKFSTLNWDEADTSAYIVIALKTKDSKTGAEKTVFVDRRKEILQKNESEGTVKQDFEFNLAYKGNASTIEIMVLECKDDETTGSAYSEVATGTVITKKAWGALSEWSTEKPEEVAGRAIETKTQYRYRTKQTTQVTDSTLSGDWVKYNTTGYWGAWSGYSGWTTNYVAANSYTDVQTKTQYQYYRCYCNKNWWHDWYGVTSCFSCSGKYSTYEYGWFDTPYSSVTTNATGDGKVKRAKLDGSVYWYYYPQYYSTRHGTRTVYRYQTRAWHTVNYYYKWNAWSEWSDQIATASSNQEVETRTVYRYKDEIVETASAEMDASGTVASFTGNIASEEDLSGKVATIMAYQSKNMDANKYQMQYIGQVEIGEGNTYDFRFIPKEEPTTDSGNYVVALGVQGTTGLINVGIIEAPKREFTVTLHYVDEQGNTVQLCEPQTVKEGEDVNLEGVEVPEREGYYFAGWGSRTTNIVDNCAIEAIYLPTRNTVVYVDWVNESIGFQTALTGEKLNPPYNVDENDESKSQTKEGYTFKGWDVLIDDPDAVVVGNMVLTAVYDVATYEVKFVDENGEAISTQDVEYGESAELPDFADPEGMYFLGWSTDEQWWNVNSDMTVEPILVYDKSAVVPVANVGSYVEGREANIELTCEEGDTIYYTTDGSDPSDPENENRQQYTEPINLTESAIITAVTEAENKNTSDPLEIVFEYTEEDYYDAYPAWEEIGTYNVVAEPNKEIVLNLKMDKNPGLMAYHFLVECDRGVFYVDCDENGNFVCESGEASADGNLFTSEYDDAGWQILWFSTEESYDEGSLFKLTLKVSEDAESGVYPVKVSYAKANTLTADALETNLNSKQVSLGIESTANLLGDANGDGSVTTMDVVRIARNVVGLAEIASEREYLADVNNDGKITIADAIKLAKILIGLEKVA